jgi:flavin reductase (DIM6/NTAB) family NADH-FMN oxidoreductase RutF/DNA-binding IclR family transcriptional regulator
METSPATDAIETKLFDDRMFRDVLGHLPSGVVAITGIDPKGQPVGMIVGTFTSVSLDPALVAFFVDKNSSSFPLMRKSGTFCANILSARQEPLCRALSTRGGNKFVGVNWQPAQSGSPILEGTVAWVDCSIDSVTEAGDHLIVLGKVQDLGVSTPTIPLLFFQGGFGGFAPAALAMDAQGVFFDTLRSVDRVRAGMESIARELEVDCLAHAVHGDNNSTVVAAAYAPKGSRTSTRVGHQLPLVPPWAEPFLAWAPENERNAWLERLRSDSKQRYDADRVHSNIEEIRETGWAFTVRTAIEDDDRALEDLVQYGYTPAVERGLVDLILRRGEHGDPSTFDKLPVGAVRNLCAPVLDDEGHLSLILVLHNLPSDLTAKQARTYLDRLLELTQRVSPA